MHPAAIECTAVTASYTRPFDWRAAISRTRASPSQRAAHLVGARILPPGTLEPEMVTHLPRPAGWTRRASAAHRRGSSGRTRILPRGCTRASGLIPSSRRRPAGSTWASGKVRALSTRPAIACRRLVQTVAAALPQAPLSTHVGNGLGTQEPVIVKVLRPRRLIAVNITEWQLSAGPRPAPRGGRAGGRGRRDAAADS